MKRLLFFVLLSIMLTNCSELSPPKLESGLKISSSAVFDMDTLELLSRGREYPVLQIEGDDITLDFQGTILRGGPVDTPPDELKGLALHIRNSRGVTIRNLHITAYETALLAENCEGLTLENCTFQYLYRTPLQAQLPTSEKQGALILNGCDSVVIQSVTVSNTQHALLLDDCKNSLVANNTIRFNAGNAITLRSSNNNRIYHNRLDWNVRINAADTLGAALDFDTGSANNIVAYNSLTHSGILPSPLAFQQNHFTNNVIDYTLKRHRQRISKYRVPAMENAQSTVLTENILKGLNSIIMGDWGPYDFKYPKAKLNYKVDGRYLFSVYTPGGSWKVADRKGFTRVTPASGANMATLSAYPDSSATVQTLQLEYKGAEVVTETGEHLPPGELVLFGWSSEQ